MLRWLNVHIGEPGFIQENQFQVACLLTETKIKPPATDWHPVVADSVSQCVDHGECFYALTEKNYRRLNS